MLLRASGEGRPLTLASQCDDEYDNPPAQALQGNDECYTSLALAPHGDDERDIPPLAYEPGRMMLISEFVGKETQSFGHTVLVADTAVR